MSPERDQGALRDTHPEDDVADGRDETPAERADRNWNEVLQELRVLQTGTQILTGFLLALAFQPAFADLTSSQQVMYLGLVVVSALSSIIALAPVALHRVLFRRHAKAIVVDGRFAYAGSINFTSYSMDKNRELGLVTADEEFVGRIADTFERDWANGRSDF